MWPPWAKSPVKIHNRSSSSSSSTFRCTSFKDIQYICTDDPIIRKPSIFHRVRLANSIVRALITRPPPPTTTDNLLEPRPEPELSADTSFDDDNNNNNSVQVEVEVVEPEKPLISIPGAEKRIVVYFTSLRVVRSTFEDCRTVRSILRGFRVQIDERDLSMDYRFLNELQAIFGGGGGNGQSKLTLPRVFIGGRYIGGAEEIRYLHEIGELKKYVEGFPAAEPGVCEECGGYRFILCPECDGSHKLYAEKAGGFKSCCFCNENGLIRCPSCSCLSDY